MNSVDWRYTRQIYTGIGCAVFMLASLVLYAPVAAAIDTEQTEVSPVLEPSITAGDLRNMQTIKLTINGDTTPKASAIRVLDNDDKVIRNDETAVAIVDTTGLTQIELSWDTRLFDDGDYKIQYSVDFGASETYSDTYAVKIMNNKPLVSVAASEQGRKVTGLVSRTDVIFRMWFNDQLTDISPSFALQPDLEGMTAWSVIVPESIPNGSVTVKVSVTPAIENGALDSDVVESKVTLSKPIVVIPAKPAHVIELLPPLNFAPTIGQFVAPAIQQLESRTRTVFYGVPVTDITSDTQPDARSASASNNAQSTVMGVQSNRTGDAAEIVAASASGWKIFGVDWYGYITLAALGLGLWWLITGLSRRNHDSPTL